MAPPLHHQVPLLQFSFLLWLHHLLFVTLSLFMRTLLLYQAHQNDPGWLLNLEIFNHIHNITFTSKGPRGYNGAASQSPYRRTHSPRKEVPLRYPKNIPDRNTTTTRAWALSRQHVPVLLQSQEAESKPGDRLGWMETWDFSEHLQCPCRKVDFILSKSQQSNEAI